MSGLSERMEALLEQSDNLSPWVGVFNQEMLMEWLRLELGHPEALDGWVEHGKVMTRAVACSPVTHIVSGNTPHAAFQSVFRGLLLGCHNRVKLPSCGLPDFEAWVDGLPEILSCLVEVSRSLPDAWLDCEAAVIFGGGETIRAFREKLGPEVRRIEHGPKLSIAVICEPSAVAAQRLAEDILRHDQRGCLSVQAVYVEGTEEAIFGFGDHLGEAMAAWRKRNGRLGFSRSDSGAVANARELARFRAANGDGLKLWESERSTEWTVLYDRDPLLLAGPLNGFVRLHPMPACLDRETLGSEAEFVSTVVLHPLSPGQAAWLDTLSPPRICEAGKAQEPTIFWHHDGMPALAGLVRWRDLG